MTPQEKLEGMIMDAVRRNPSRDHDAAEFAIQFSSPPKYEMPLPAVIMTLAALVERGELVQRTWNGGVVYGLPDVAAASN